MAITGKALVAAAFAAVTAALLATPASATVASDSVCEPAKGPGDWSKHCIDVTGHGLNVDSVHGYLNSTKIPGYPAQICGVRVTVWGEKANGEHYEDSGVNGECGLGSAGIMFPLNNTAFRDGSLLCARTSFDNYVPVPACVTIRG